MHRQITENGMYFSQKFTRMQAWIDLLLLAGHKEHTIYIRGNEINLKPGELAYAQRTLAKRWGWNYRTVDRYLNDLEKREMIQRRKSNITTVISINNWSFYQGGTTQSATQSTTQTATQSATKQKCKEKAAEGSNGQYPVETNKEFYQFINKFVSACRSHGLFVNENVATLKLKKAYEEYGYDQMRLCFNDVIDKAKKKKDNGEKIRCMVQYGLQVLRNDYLPVNGNRDGRNY